MKIKNISNKIIGIGDVTVLPGESKEVPKPYETSPILAVYKESGMAEISNPSISGKTAEQQVVEQADKEKKIAQEEETLRQARLASLEGISQEALGTLANELGINPAESKDQSDVLKKVKATLKSK